MNLKVKFRLLSICIVLFLLSVIMVSCQNKSMEKPVIDETKKEKNLIVPKREVWFSDFKDTAELTEEERILVAKEIAFVITGKKDSIELPEKLENDMNPAIIFIAASDGKTTATVTAGSGKGIRNAVEDTVSRFGKNKNNPEKPACIRIDFISKAKLLEKTGSKEYGVEEENLFGLGIDGDVQEAFLPPELLSKNLLDKKGKLKSYKFKQILIKKAEEKIGSSLDIEKLKLDIYEYNSYSYFYDGEEVVSLYRGHRMFPELTPKILIKEASLGGDYLINALNEEGKFDYNYYLYLDYSSKDYNMLRHAGTVYSMLQLYEITRDEKLLKASEKAIEYLLKYVNSFKSKKGIISMVIFKNKIKLGTNAVTILALTKYTQVTGDKKYLMIAQNLARWIKNSQAKNGSFRIHIQTFPDGKIPYRVPLYYPGETILALTRLYEIDGNSDWLQVAKKAAGYQEKVYFKIVRNDSIEIDHWVVFALNGVYKYDKRPEFVTLCFKIVDKIQEAQNKNTRYPDWDGGYYQPPRCTPTATRSEALLYAYQIAEQSGKTGRLEEIYTTLLNNVKFQLNCEVRPEAAMFLENPQKALGGFQRNLTGPDIRIDYNQHNISSLVGLYRLMRERGKNKK